MSEIYSRDSTFKRMHKIEILRLMSAFRAAANNLDADAELFDDTGKSCKCCQMVRYNDFTEKQLKDRVVGVAIRLREIADTMERRLIPARDAETRSI